MRRYRVREATSRSGEEIRLLEGPDGKLVFWPNVFATGEYRNTGRSPDTIAKLLRTIAMGEVWAIANGRDLDADLMSGPFLSVEDADGLLLWMSLTVDEQYAELERRRAVARTPNLRRLESFRRAAARSDSERRGPSESEIGTRLRWMAKYAESHLARRVQSMVRKGDDPDEFRASAERTIEKLRDLAPSPPPEGDQEPLEGVSKTVLQIIENIMTPGSGNGWRNPWRSQFVQWRNYLFWRLLLDAGGRRGEKRGVMVRDVIPSMRRVHLLESKTVARTVPITPHTAAVFDHFVTEYWSKIPRTKRAHGYLLTQKNGRRLSLRQLNRIFEVLRKCSGGMVPSFVTPHTIRRSWNDILSAKVDAQPADQRSSDEKETQIRNRLQGWSPNSRMGGKYARRHLRAEADRIAEQLMSSIGPLKLDDEIPF